MAKTLITLTDRGANELEVVGQIIPTRSTIVAWYNINTNINELLTVHITTPMATINKYTHAVVKRDGRTYRIMNTANDATSKKVKVELGYSYES